MTTETVPYTFHMVDGNGVVEVPNPKESAYLQCAYLKIIVQTPYTVTENDGVYTIEAPGFSTLIFKPRRAA
jgi:hypothetical protein